MKYSFLLFVLWLLFSACMKGEHVDLIIHNARVHVMDESLTIEEAVAISDGKIVEVGPERQILNKYSGDEEIDAQGKDIYPGLTDAHGHIFSYANQKLNLDLVGSKSLQEVVYRCEKFYSLTGKNFLIGRGWDQTIFGKDEMPNSTLLNEKFPQIAICLYRVDGHAVLINDYLLKKAGITAKTKIDGGEIEIINGKPSGLLIDNAMNLIEPYLPKNSYREMEEKFMEIQRELVQYGITGVHEAGISFEQLKFLKKIIKKNKLDLNVYAMLLPSNKNKEFARKNGPFSYRNLEVKSFKVYVDGALGSRGALLKKSYSDKANSKGLLLTQVSELRGLSDFCLNTNYQLNFHGIGDSSISLILDICKSVFERKKDHRFRIEHAQVIDPNDLKKFADFAVFPSVQPTHAVSDCRWVEQRIGKSRLNGAYAYKSLINQYGMVAIGTDFPVENIDPFATIHAATQRKNINNQPANGFLLNESISFDEVMKGMTIWAAFAEFSENKRGTIEKGKEATIVIFDKPLSPTADYTQNFAWKTFIRGKLVFQLGEL